MSKRKISSLPEAVVSLIRMVELERQKMMLMHLLRYHVKNENEKKEMEEALENLSKQMRDITSGFVNEVKE